MSAGQSRPGPGLVPEEPVVLGTTENLHPTTDLGETKEDHNISLNRVFGFILRVTEGQIKYFILYIYL